MDYARLLLEQRAEKIFTAKPGNEPPETIATKKGGGQQIPLDDSELSANKKNPKNQSIGQRICCTRYRERIGIEAGSHHCPTSTGRGV